MWLCHLTLVHIDKQTKKIENTYHIEPLNSIKSICKIKTNIIKY